MSDIKLSKRENQIISLIRKKLKRKTMAIELGINYPDVYKYCKRIQDKLGFESYYEMSKDI